MDLESDCFPLNGYDLSRSLHEHPVAGLLDRSAVTYPANNENDQGCDRTNGRKMIQQEVYMSPT